MERLSAFVVALVLGCSSGAVEAGDSEQGTGGSVATGVSVAAVPTGGEMATGGSQAKTSTSRGTGGSVATGGATDVTETTPSEEGGSGGEDSVGGFSATGGATHEASTATGGVVSTGGTTARASVPQDCRYITESGRDIGLCTTSFGRSYCNDAGECTLCPFGTLDCDYDGVCESKANSEHCRHCGDKCQAAQECIIVDGGSSKTEEFVFICDG